MMNNDTIYQLVENTTNLSIGSRTEDSRKYLIKGVQTTIPKLVPDRKINKFTFNTSKYNHVVYIVSNKPELYDFLPVVRNLFTTKPNFIIFNQTFKVSNTTVRISNLNSRKLITSSGFTPVSYSSVNGKQKAVVSDVSGLMKYLFNRYSPTSPNLLYINFDLFEITKTIPSYIIHLDDNLDAPVWMYKMLFNLYTRLVRSNYVPDLNIFFYQESTEQFYVVNTVDDVDIGRYRKALVNVLKLVYSSLDKEAKKKEAIKRIKEKVAASFQVQDEEKVESILTSSELTTKDLEQLSEKSTPEDVASVTHKSLMKSVVGEQQPTYKTKDIEKARRYAAMRYIFLDSIHLDVKKMKEKVKLNTPLPVDHIFENYYKNNVGHSILNHLKESYSSSVDMLDILVKKSVENALGFKIISKEVYEKTYKVLDEIVTDGTVVVYVIQDTTGVKHTFELFLPKVYENGTMRINSNNYILNTQLFPTPLKAKNTSELRFQSLTTQMKIVKSTRNLYVELGDSVRIPVGILFIYMKSLEELSRLLDFKYRITDVKSIAGEKNITQFTISKDKVLVIENFDSLSEGTKLILTSMFKYIEKYHDKIDGEPFSYEWNQKLLGTFKNFDLNTYIKPIVNNLIDPITETYLKQIGYTNDAVNTLVEVSKDFVEHPEKFVVRRNDIRYYRVRTYEQITNFYSNLLFQELFTVRRNIERFKDYKPKPVVMRVSQSVAQLISGQPILRLLEYQNPLEEYVNFFKVTYGGYLGIKNENVPMDARSVLKDAKGTIDPVDTPEGQNTGATQTLSNSHRIVTQTGMISTYNPNEKMKGSMLGPSLSLVPFGRFSEPTRLLITSNQIKQPLPIQDAEPPALMTGFESVVAYNSSFSTKIAKKNGTVVYSGSDRIDVKYDDGGIESIKLDTQNLKSGQGYYLTLNFKTNLKKGDKVQEGQIIAYSDFVDENGLYKYGKNVTVAFMQFPGTYEDGIVVSESVVESYRSKHTQKYKLFLSTLDSLVEFKIEEIGQKVEAGEQIIKVISNSFTEYVNSELFEGVELDYTISGYSVVNKVQGVVRNVKIIASNSFMKNIRSDVLPKVKKFMKMSNEVVYYKQKPLDGMYIEIYIDYELPLQVGDKLVSRHANKGVVSRILPEEKMPVITDNNQRVDMIFSPASIVDRTITALLYEIYINMISEKLASIVKKNNYSLEKSFNYIKLLETFDHKETNGFYSQYVSSILSDQRTKKFITNFIKQYNMFPIIVPSFMEPTVEQIQKVMKVLDIPSKRKVRLESGHEVECVAGKLYVLKLEHVSSKKLSARSIGAYNAFGSAVGKSDKGQKISELDMLSFISWDIPKILEEINLDSPVAKRNIYQQIIHQDVATLENTINSLPRDLQLQYRNSVEGTRALLEGALLEL